jgi:DNA-binding transcriptional ArsR family regulator
VSDSGFFEDLPAASKALEPEEEGPTYQDLVWFSSQCALPDARPAEPPREWLRFLWGREFLGQPREQRAALLGSDYDCLIPAAGLVIVGGPGGAGKSTLTLHAIAHLASGTDWLGIPIADALRIGVIENEGPKEPFMDKVERFAEAWEGPDFLKRCAFLDSPWGRFTLADEGLRAELRAFVVEAELDLVVAGPLGLLGVEGVGSPEETRAFLSLLVEVGYRRDIAFWLLHHIKKGRHPSIVQALSGDWGGHPDLILGVEQKEGERLTTLTFGKVRWGDQGRRPLSLEWLPDDEGIGYRIVDREGKVEEGKANRRRILDAIRRGLRTAAEIAPVVDLTPRSVTRHMKALAEDGEVVLEEGQNGTYIASTPSETPGGPVAPEELPWE